MRPSTLGWCALVAGLALATPAHAHDAVQHAAAGGTLRLPVETSATAAHAVPGMAPLLAALVVAAVAIGRSRRAVAVTCLAVLALVAFEAGVHSVHHLADQRGAECAVAKVSAQAGGVTIECERVPLPEDRGLLAIVPHVAWDASRAVPPDLGRAPPCA